jgi:Cu(I)/Ag(I) efflux system membrane protein CusA/SilA
MWSTRTGAEIMKPLATPVLGGMVSSLLHVLIVTPVIFYWLRARRLPRAEFADLASTPDAGRVFRPATPRTLMIAAVVVIAVVMAIAWPSLRRTTRVPDGPAIQTVTSGDVRATLRSPSGTFTQGRNRFSIDFEDARGRPIDVGDVRLTATMPMPGMAMPGGVEVTRGGAAGHYTAAGDFGMSGVWQMTLQWDGPAGHGSTSFQGRVQ